MKILIVDDNRDLADSYAELMAVLGHTACAAYSGKEGIEAAATMGPDAVLLDLQMPGMSGWDVAHALRERYGATVKIVAHSACDEWSSHGAAAQAEFDGRLVKPIAVERILALMQRVVGSQRP